MMTIEIKCMTHFCRCNVEFSSIHLFYLMKKTLFNSIQYKNNNYAILFEKNKQETLRLNFKLKSTIYPSCQYTQFNLLVQTNYDYLSLLRNSTLNYYIGTNILLTKKKNIFKKKFIVLFTLAVQLCSKIVTLH